jgi:hypothetical protein
MNFKRAFGSHKKNIWHLSSQMRQFLLNFDAGEGEIIG